MYAAQQEQYLHSLCDNIDTLVGDKQVKLAWAAINNIDRLKLRYAHFKNLLSPEDPPPPCPIELEPSQGLSRLTFSDRATYHYGRD